MSDSVHHPVSRLPGPSSRTLSTRRERLREFQAGLSEKLRRAQNAPLTVSRLGLQIGQRRLLIDLADAGEILTVPDIMPVPLTKAWYAGLANVRGNLLGVVDLSIFAGGAATTLDKESRVLAFASGLQFSTGILVTRMLGLRNATDLRASDGAAGSNIVEPRSGSASSRSDADAADLFAPWVRATLVDGQGLHWQELDLAALTADERFSDIARA